jgi:Ca-activated chloride channel family protein
MARSERRLIRAGGSYRHVDFEIRVASAAVRAATERPPLSLALVLDRSGSMSGDKLETAKRAALAVLEQIEERDTVAVVTFDDQIDVLQRAERASSVVKARIRAGLSQIEARASTALHEGWLTGCRAIAADSAPDGRYELARCFLLTDGQANVGLTDPELIASEAAGVRAHAGIGTSTFGIGPDYDELLLGPMAVAGGGQFYNLRTPAEIVNTFVGELGGMLAVAARQVRLEVAIDPDLRLETISDYWTTGPHPDAIHTVDAGDLMAGEERHLVVRFGFPPKRAAGERLVRARVVWIEDGAQRATEWQTLRFTYGDTGACNSELRDPAAMHWIGLHHADRARREATQLNRRGDLRGARERVKRVRHRIAEYAGADRELVEALAELRDLERQVAQAELSSMEVKEVAAESYRRSRSQIDRR